MNWLDKLVFNYPKISTTKTLALRAKKFEADNTSVVRPSLSQKIIALLFIGFAGMMALALSLTLFRPAGLIIVALLAFLCVLGIIGLLAYQFFFNEKVVFDITLSEKCINIRHDRLAWIDINETYIIQRQEGKTTVYYLILQTKTGEAKKYNLKRFGISVYKLSAMIEHYKKQYAPQF